MQKMYCAIQNKSLFNFSRKIGKLSIIDNENVTKRLWCIQEDFNL